MSYYPGSDYNACISITILPTILKELTHAPSEYIFKATFQLLFAVMPVMVYAFARRYLDESLAFLAGFLFAAQTWFYEQMPALIRQEVAFIFYMALLLALFDERLKKRTRSWLLYLFTAAMVLSHYSTAYVWIALLLVALIISYGSRFFIHSLREQTIAIKPMMLAASLVFLFIWQIPITHTATAFTNFVTNKQPPILASSTASAAPPSSVTPLHVAEAVVAAPIALPFTVVAQNAVQNAIMTSLFASGNPNTDQEILMAEQKAIRVYGGQAGYNTYPNSESSGYVPQAINENISVAPKLPEFVSSLIGFLVRIAKLLLIDVFPLIGIAGIYIALRRRSANKGYDGKYDFVILNSAAYVLIALMILIPYLQAHYNVTRLYLQMFLTLGICAVIGGAMVMKYLPRYRTLALAVMVVIIFCSLSGTFDQFTGGSARITLDQPPSTLDGYDIHDSEIAGAQWLALHRNPNATVQADVVANLRLQSFTDTVAANIAIFPQTLEQNSYIYLINKNIAEGIAYYQYNNNVLTYDYPSAFLNSHKNLIYNDGGSRVYR